MNLKTWTSNQRGRSLWLAEMLFISPPMVSDWCTGKKAVPIERCVPIERATDGAVTRQDLRPDDWQDIWPELAQSHVNCAQVATHNVANEAVQTTDTGTLRSGAERRAKAGPPFQSVDVGVA